MMAPETVVTVETNNRPTNQNQTQSQQMNLDWLKVNTAYFKTTPGILKIAELILGILCMALASPAWVGASHFFLFVATVSFITTIVWTLVYLLSVREALSLPVDWITTELLNTTISTVLYFLAFIIQLATWSWINSPFRAANIAAGVFGLFITLAYAGSVYFLYGDHKNRQPTTA